MSTITRERLPSIRQAEASESDASAEWAWVWLLATPVTVIAGMLLAIAVYVEAGVDWTNPTAAPQRVDEFAKVAAAVPMMGAPLLALIQGARAGRQDSSSGIVAAALGALLLFAMGVWIFVV